MTVMLLWLEVTRRVLLVLYDNATFIVSASDTSRFIGFSAQGASATSTTIQTSQTVNRTITTPDFDGKALVEQSGTGFVFIGQTAQDHGSNSGIQQSSLVANRAQLRVNQYGANNAGPGITGFKSRSTVIGQSQSVQVGDILWRMTAIGVCGDNSTIPLAATVSINAVAVGTNYVGTEYEVALTSAEGPTNSRHVVQKITSFGYQQYLESGSTNPQPAPKTPPTDLVTLGAGGTLTVLNHIIPANARIFLTVQPGQAPVGIIYVSAISAGVSFTITSTSASDAGVNVYYEIRIPLL